MARSWIARRLHPPAPIPRPVQVAGRIEAAQGDGFLRALKHEWENHNKSVQMIRDILMYMDRIYVKQQAGAVPAHAPGRGAARRRRGKGLSASWPRWLLAAAGRALFSGL